MVLDILSGPDKPALEWAIAYGSDGQRVHFDTQGDSFDAQIISMDELPGGSDFTLIGLIRSGNNSGTKFEATYSLTTRTGTLRTAV